MLANGLWVLVMICCMCDSLLEGYGTKMVHFALDEEKLIEYYCSTRCIVEGYSR